MPRKPRTPNATAQARYAAKQKRLGFVAVKIWVPVEAVDKVKALGAKLRKIARQNETD